MLIKSIIIPILMDMARKAAPLWFSFNFCISGTPSWEVIEEKLWSAKTGISVKYRPCILPDVLIVYEVWATLFSQFYRIEILTTNSEMCFIIGKTWNYQPLALTHSALNVSCHHMVKHSCLFHNYFVWLYVLRAYACLPVCAPTRHPPPPPSRR